MKITIARTMSQVVAAGEVIHDAFVAEGIIRPQPSGVFLHAQHLTSSGLLVLAVDGAEVLGTTGVILDGVGRLPLDDVFGPTLNELRAAHSRIAEIGVIASRDRLDSDILDQVICAAWWWATRMGAPYIVTSCHPHHSRYYERRYGVHKLTGTRLYPKFHDAQVDLLGASWERGLAHRRGGKMLRRFEPALDFYQGRYAGGWSCIGCSRGAT